MALTEAFDTAYPGPSSLLLLPMYSRLLRKSLRSTSNMPSSSANSKTRVMTLSWVSLRSSRRESNCGPISEIVERTGVPFLPKRSQKATG